MIYCFYLDYLYRYRSTCILLHFKFNFFQVIEHDMLEQLDEHNFLDHSLQILTDFCKDKDGKYYIGK